MSLDRSAVFVAMQQATARLAAHVPPPPEVAVLAPLRTRVAEEVFARHEVEVEAARRAFLDDEDAAPLGQLAEALVDEMRREVARRAADEGSRLAAALAALDLRMPTRRDEFIDRDDFDEARRTRAIRDLDRINRVLGSYARFLDVLSPLLPASGEATVLDLASGHGGFPLALAALARDRGLRLRVIASDIRPEYVAIGQERAEAALERDVEFRVVDAFHLARAFGPGEVDLVTCTQSLHHFGAGGIAALVAASLRVAGRGIAFVDPGRGVTSLAGIAALTAVTCANPWLLHDGVVSIRKSFVPEEMALIARLAPGGEGLASYWMAPGFVVLRTAV